MLTMRSIQAPSSGLGAEALLSSTNSARLGRRYHHRLPAQRRRLRGHSRGPHRVSRRPMHGMIRHAQHHSDGGASHSTTTFAVITNLTPSACQRTTGGRAWWKMRSTQNASA